MKRECRKCGKEYQVGQFRLDSGYCDECQPGFFSVPSMNEFFSLPWGRPRPSTPAETKSLLIAMIVVHAVLFLFFSMMLDGGVLSAPAMLYLMLVSFYLLGRLILWSRAKDGGPCLSVVQRTAILLMPFYGLPLFLLIWRLIRTVLFGE